MFSNDDRTTLVCLYHHRDHAQAALEDILKAGIPEEAVTMIGGNSATADKGSHAAGSGMDDVDFGTQLTEIGVPERDRKHLIDSLLDGGALLSVAAITDHVDTVEGIFKRYSEKIDEAETGNDRGFAAPIPAVPPVAAGERTIPIVEEDLLVGKRTVDQGGVRIYRRVVEIPVETSVDLREEHVNVDRHAVDRPVEAGDMPFQARSIELTETAEEAVIGKTARVVEEIVVGKQTTERTEHISDTVRHTEVELEEVPASGASALPVSDPALRDR